MISGQHALKHAPVQVGPVSRMQKTDLHYGIFVSTGGFRSGAAAPINSRVAKPKLLQIASIETSSTQENQTSPPVIIYVHAHSDYIKTFGGVGIGKQ